ncbi:MAG: lipoyl synthase [Candidatus Hydrogenedentes bacterium]|nr:lipoyl synthase [Candidatus Hydrogenedentota bacterium]
MALNQFPTWIRRPWPSGKAFREVKDLLNGMDLHTVCQSAHCPNQSECWSRRTATFMVLGNTCTRHCTYCAVNSGKPMAPDPDEPEKVAEAVRRLGLRHAVLTSVTRDDLPDGGAGHIAATIRAIKRLSPGTTQEVLVQDFVGDVPAIELIVAAKPEIFSHNIETVRRIFPKLRDRRFSYDLSLEVLRIARARIGRGFVKSSFMLGCGETEADIQETLHDLLVAGCDAVSMGQYLQPTPKHQDVEAFIPPEIFTRYESMARDMGFSFAVAGPFVRSSYRSEALLQSEFGRERLQTSGAEQHAD